MPNYFGMLSAVSQSGLGETSPRLGGFRHDGGLANPKGG
jgi:hypothetical protein